MLIHNQYRIQRAPTLGSLISSTRFAVLFPTAHVGTWLTWARHLKLHKTADRNRHQSSSLLHKNPNPHVKGFELIQLCCSHAELGGECLRFQYEEEDDCAPERIAVDQVSLFSHSRGIQSSFSDPGGSSAS